MRFLLIGGLALAMLPGAVHPQGKRAGQYLTVPFSVHQAELPRGFQGHDCVSLAARLKRSRLQKSEFESAADYERRVATAMEHLSLGPGLKASDLVAFVVPPTVLRQEMTYNAENRTASFGYDRVAMHTSGFALIALGIPSGNPIFTILTLSEQRTPFVGSTAFGARVRAESVTRKVCAAAVTNWTGSMFSEFSSATATLEPAIAKDLSENFGVLFIGRVAPPLYAEGFHVRSATIDSPVRLRVDGDVIAMELVDIWYFNKRTGAVAVRVAPRPAVATPLAIPVPPLEAQPAQR